MDHYVVYVSSLTESALWELDQLHTDQRRGRVTVVFDEDAIGKKASQLALQEALAGRLGEAIWAKQGGPPSLTAAQVREGLTKVFKVMDPDEFEAEHRRRQAPHRRLQCRDQTWGTGDLARLRVLSGSPGRRSQAFT